MITECYDHWTDLTQPLVSLEIIGEDKLTTIYALQTYLVSFNDEEVCLSDFEYFLSIVDQMILKELDILKEKLKSKDFEAAQHLKRITHRAYHTFVKETDQYFEMRSEYRTSYNCTEEFIRRIMITGGFSYRIQHFL
ncbi:hypothetical protein O0Q50_22325 [Priestia aryabhattai]|uniref:Uncharacterized protein n=1 Tax=Priestia aryabhattai TaxID=412384 RepID=A0AAX6NDD8_PRIAR|nr:hypothetical protein [Priestia aryabhattai]MDU9693921.1 hypothetical protein [Priestia aryabhattai]